MGRAKRHSGTSGGTGWAEFQGVCYKACASVLQVAGARAFLTSGGRIRKVLLSNSEHTLHSCWPCPTQASKVQFEE